MRYQESLTSAAGPLVERLGTAYRQLAESQNAVQAELSGRIVGAYQDFSARIVAIPGESSLLEPAVAAYRRYVDALGAYTDFSRLSGPITEMRGMLDAGLRDAVGQPDAAERAADALGTFHGNLNQLLADDPLRVELDAALTAYAESLGALQADIVTASQGAVDALTEALAQAVAEAGEGGQSDTPLATYASETQAIGAALAGAYEAAVKEANDYLRDNLAEAGIPMDAAPEAMPAMGAAFMAEPAMTSPAAGPEAAEAGVEGVAAEALPRAAWVDIPPPPTRAWQAPSAADATETDGDVGDAEDGGNGDTPATPTRPRRARPPAGRKPPG